MKTPAKKTKAKLNTQQKKKTTHPSEIKLTVTLNLQEVAVINVGLNELVHRDHYEEAIPILAKMKEEEVLGKELLLEAREKEKENGR